ncbi:MAG: 2-oxoglutarate ferredoxin oxidoreductase, alpha subunit [Myxococcaceae bacterium]|nr:2-oxoglutarate ferredoxin oxidoreductase, alpha subunit [Myxococcaceae bacterium]
MQAAPQTVESVVIRFAGDSGDGMQLTGTQFTETSALAGNDLATFPDFPAEIRAPAGSLAGVSGFQVHISSLEVFTPGDEPDVLIAMNPAALKANLKDLKKNGVLILDVDQFTEKNLTRVGYKTNPIDDGSLNGWHVHKVDITGITLKAIEGSGLSQRAAVRSKNFFALGLVYWMYSRTLDHTLAWIDAKFKGKEDIAEANRRALKAGYHYGETVEVFAHTYEVSQAEIEPGTYKNMSGNEALALGLMAAAELSGLDLFLGSYPITPASDILHALSKHKHMGVRTFQAEDEIAAVAAAVGASYAGSLAITTTSGPGMLLKAEAINLALMMELPLLIIDVQRGGPSTGLPTKTEQSDLLMAMYGRNGESPIPIIAPRAPGDCFYAAIEAARIALESMTPVILLSDGYIANGAEPWKVPDMAKIAPISVKFHTDPATYKPYGRDDKLARPWAIPGTPGLEHRIGGLEKENVTGQVSYTAENHELMSRVRQEKVQKVAERYPRTEIYGDEAGELLVIGWGGTFGAIRAGVKGMREHGHKIGQVHLRNLNPLPNDLGDILKRYKRVLVPELNLGQLSMLLRARYLVDAKSYTKIQGKPFKESEILDAIRAQLETN